MTIEELIDRYDAARDAMIRANHAEQKAISESSRARRDLSDASDSLILNLGNKGVIHKGKFYVYDSKGGVAVHSILNPESTP